MPEVPLPLVDLTRQHALLRGELMAAIEQVLAGGQFIQGPALDGFERRFAAFCGTRYAVGTSSGTSAIHLALIAAGIGAGDEVIVPALTFIATLEPVIQLGATPVLADVDRATGLIDVASVRRLISERTRAILPVHLHGQMAAMGDLADIASQAPAPVALLEDACQAHGATQAGHTAGSLGALAGFSFHPAKVLGACGDAGAVTTSDPDHAARVARLADHGRATKYTHLEPGYNYRMDALQAAILDVKLRHVASWLAARRTIAARYDAGLAGIPQVAGPVVAPGNAHVYHVYAIRAERRDALRADLAEQGIASGIHYPVPLQDQPAVRSARHRRDALPAAEALCAQLVSLPIYPEMVPADVDRVLAAIARFYDR